MIPRLAGYLLISAGSFALAMALVIVIFSGLDFLNIEGNKQGVSFPGDGYITDAGDWDAFTLSLGLLIYPLTAFFLLLMPGLLLLKKKLGRRLNILLWFLWLYSFLYLCYGDFRDANNGAIGHFLFPPKTEPYMHR